MDRETVARKLAEKDENNFDNLTDMMKKAYLHNADEAIIDAGRIAVKKGLAAPTSICPRCDGSGWKEGKACLECNPVGLSKETLKGYVQNKQHPPVEMPKMLIIPGAILKDGETVDEFADKARAIIKSCSENQAEEPEQLGKYQSYKDFMKDIPIPQVEPEIVHEEILDDNTSDSGTGRDNQPTGSGITRQSQLKRKSKKSKSTRAKSS